MRLGAALSGLSGYVGKKTLGLLGGARGALWAAGKYSRAGIGVIRDVQSLNKLGKSISNYGRGHKRFEQPSSLSQRMPARYRRSWRKRTTRFSRRNRFRRKRPLRGYRSVKRMRPVIRRRLHRWGVNNTMTLNKWILGYRPQRKRVIHTLYERDFTNLKRTAANTATIKWNVADLESPIDGRGTSQPRGYAFMGSSEYTTYRVIYATIRGVVRIDRSPNTTASYDDVLVLMITGSDSTPPYTSFTSTQWEDWKESIHSQAIRVHKIPLKNVLNTSSSQQPFTQWVKFSLRIPLRKFTDRNYWPSGGAVYGFSPSQTVSVYVHALLAGLSGGTVTDYGVGVMCKITYDTIWTKDEECPIPPGPVDE